MNNKATYCSFFFFYKTDVSDSYLGNYSHSFKYTRIEGMVIV